MRTARRDAKKRLKRDEDRTKGRELALQFLRGSRSIRKAVDEVYSKTGIKISKGSVGSLRKALHEGDQEQLQKLLNPAMFRAGRKTVLSKSAQHMIFKTAIFDSERGRAWNMTDFRISMGKIATDGRENSFKGTVAGAASLRQFRVDNPDITFRNKVNKEISKQRGESFDHVKTFEGVLQNIFENNPEIARDPNKIWNMDETGIDCEFGQKEKVASSSSSNHSGSRISADGSGTGVHVTCVVAVSASGLRCPPFLYYSRKTSNVVMD